MKTFKLITLQVVEEDSLVDIDLIDGLIINQENEQNTWMLEAYVNKSYHDYFQELYEKGEDVIVQVVITKKENSPAAFQTKILTIKQVSDKISILFEGKLMKTNYDYAEIVLKKLIGQGLSSEELLQEFKKILREKPKITAAKSE
ncbi:YwpF-like family protein [Bacillus sp. S/N-304-OC-R1]|uniref:YwpF-like family protein n=1 Tax=Bacillus sp. S/N-304-OC-R1 TaxID=2758034 RepID=UPI001C8EA2AA|nr:YwpF-like family protein [Bacillus sp. S/N-304-OC-R1]MBY0122276.1 YwpF-like family protein [Bacillus sp. S/N-304-OC-R1]